jgi:FkbM family methyltransferase
MEPALKGYRLVRGFLVPEGEAERAIERRFRADGQIAKVVAHCSQRRVAVQAGGNWGYWPKRFCGLFESVYTFEPDQRSFVALAANTVGCENLIRLQAALGREPKLVGMHLYPHKTGAQFVEGEGIVPTIALDSLDLKHVDLIYLDAEGMELAALQGAKFTINRQRPLIAFEDKGLSDRYGNKSGAAQEWLERVFGYRAIDHAGHDTVMKC